MLGMDAASDVLMVGIVVLVSLAVVAAIVFQWRDDHNWMNRPRR